MRSRSPQGMGERGEEGHITVKYWCNLVSHQHGVCVDQVPQMLHQDIHVDGVALQEILKGGQGGRLCPPVLDST